MSSKASFASQVSAVSPLKGDAIDGSPAPKTRKRSGPRRDFDVDAHREFACPNKNCNHREWSHERQLAHLGKEYWKVVKALARLAPDSLEALKLTGGVILKDLTDDECRDAMTETYRLGSRGEAVPLQTRLRRNEYQKRVVDGTLRPLTREEVQARRRGRYSQLSDELAALPIEQVVEGWLTYRRLKKDRQPIPKDVSRLASEYRQRRRDGQLGAFTPAVNPARRKWKDTAAATTRAERQAALPPPEECYLRRAALGLTAGQVGEKIGADAATIRRWEQDRTVPRSQDLLEAYVQLLASADLEAPKLSPRSAKEAERRAEWPPERIRELRAKLGMPAPHLAKLLGVNTATITRWTQGHTTPTTDGIARLNALLESYPEPDPRVCARPGCGNSLEGMNITAIYCSKLCRLSIHAASERERRKRLRDNAAAS